MRQIRFRLQVMIIFSWIIFVSSGVLLLSAEDLPMHFAVIGDRTGDAQHGVYESILAEISRLQPEFIITVGDMIEGYTKDQTELEKEWLEYKGLTSTLTCPLYFTPGNHDITFDDALEMYIKYAGQPYYSFTIRKNHFVILDTSRWESSEELPQEQLTWLRADLKKHNKAERKFIFMHKPFWYLTLAENKPDALHTIFKEYGVTAVFTGHFHLFFSSSYDGISYTSVGSSGGACDERPAGYKYSYCWVTVQNDQVQIAPIKSNSVLAWDDVPVTLQKAMDKIEQDGFHFHEPVFMLDDFSVAQTKLTFDVTNFNPVRKLEGVLSISMLEHWKVVPDRFPVVLDPGQYQTITLEVAAQPPVFPGPRMTLSFPVGGDKDYQYEQYVPIARKLLCYQTTVPPIIDGHLEDKVWRAGISQLLSPDGQKMMTDPVTFYFAHDPRNLFLGAYCHDKDLSKISTHAQQRDAAVYLDDCVGYFFQPDPDQDVVYQIYINAQGTVFDQKIVVAEDGRVNADTQWDGTYVIKTRTGEAAWAVEIAIPLDQFQTNVSSGDIWKLNFRRKQTRLQTSADWLIPINYNPKTYGFMVME
ncbi:metallophosphoesterase [bacterium]|nr:metallophosphoesterase [bacterium]